LWQAYALQAFVLDLSHTISEATPPMKPSRRSDAPVPPAFHRSSSVDASAALVADSVEFMGVVRRLGESIESADSYTQGHCERVAELATLLARDAGLDPSILLWFHMGALLHDVGKLSVPRDVLNKRGSLLPDEMALIREHPAAGESLVDSVQFPWDVRPMIRGHHEHWNGSGYPDGLRGEDIPLTARILCIADVYDALTSQRPYRPARTHEDAVDIMVLESGTKFDPELLHTFVNRTLPEYRRQTSTTESSSLLKVPA
jgi:putative nucleotidyltransferase with HDIG domain